ncbi:MAG: hypothetical protein SWE60_13435 [Thermodesulfobacteriota bacterium]|nr:hypothetical protein [Thermodesulfobacteriota bacterium]
MKRQIRRLSPHQNGKVVGVLTAVITLPMFLLMMIPMLFMMPKLDNAGNPIDFAFPFGMFLLMPLFYLVFTYLFVVVGCWLYNKLFKLLGGFEFEFREEGSMNAENTLI